MSTQAMQPVSGLLFSASSADDHDDRGGPRWALQQPHSASAPLANSRRVPSVAAANKAHTASPSALTGGNYGFSAPAHGSSGASTRRCFHLFVAVGLLALLSLTTALLLSHTPLLCASLPSLSFVTMNQPRFSFSHSPHASIQRPSLPAKHTNALENPNSWPRAGPNAEPDDEPPKLFLYRLIGNSLPPLQCNSQLFSNTRYALEHEPRHLVHGRRLWVLNHMMNTTEQALLVDLLLRHGYSMEDILILRINFTDVARRPKKEWTPSITAQNEARNFILRHGVEHGARWILPFDGNQFITGEAWSSLLSSARRCEAHGLMYFKVPMYRVYREQHPSWLKGDTSFSQLPHKFVPFLWESQMAFRNDSSHHFSEGMLYGKDNKLELIDRICGTGRFDEDSGIKQRRGRGLGFKSAGGREAVRGEVDREACGCHREVGNDRRIRSRNDSVAEYCGYSIRLWYHPCKQVDARRVFIDRRYRARLREEGKRFLDRLVLREMRGHGFGA